MRSPKYLILLLSLLTLLLSVMVPVSAKVASGVVTLVGDSYRASPLLEAKWQQGCGTFKVRCDSGGQYTQQDPLCLGGGDLLSQYVSDPVTLVDVFGLQGSCGTSKYSASTVNGRKVYKNSVDVTPGTPKSVHRSVNKSVRNKVEKEGWTNKDLMQKGYAPIGPDGKQVNLHHVLGKEPGPMVELTSSVHKKHHKPLHGLIENGRSFRHDSSKLYQYDKFRQNYWKNRSLDF